MERISNSHDHIENAVPEAERRSILLGPMLKSPTRSIRSTAPIAPEWLLVFDTETTPDEAQRLRFGVYQLLQKGLLETAWSLLR